MEARYQSPNDQYNDRIPDVSFTSGWRPLVKEGSVPRMPDLVIEIKSPDDTIKEMRETAAYYLANGARLVWLVYPHSRLVEVHRPHRDFEILGEGELLTGDDALPGFLLPVSELFIEPGRK